MNTDNNNPSSSSSGYRAYAQTQNVAENSRDIEYRLLAQVTGSLVKANEAPDNTKKRIESAIWNRDVWSALRVDLCSEENQLPNDLKASLVSLSLWIERETNAVIDGKGDIEALIEVNRNIMNGLRPDNNDGDAASAGSNG